MSNSLKYKKAFIEGLGVDDKIITDKLKYNDIPEWDSIGHMTLMSNLEEAFSKLNKMAKESGCRSPEMVSWLKRRSKRG